MSQSETVTEIVGFKTVDGVSADELIQIINKLDDDYLSKTKGYIDTELVKGKEEHSWIVIIHWRSMAEASEAIQDFPASDLTKDFRRIQDPKSISFHFAEQVQLWKAA